MLSNIMLILASFALFSHSALSQTCYWPNGAEADGAYKPCANGRGACCYDIDDQHHDTCYDNGFCFSLYWGYLYRGACTDSNWSDGSGCATQCLNCTWHGYRFGRALELTRHIAGSDEGIGITFCNVSNSLYQCCGQADGNGSCCDSGEQIAWNNASVILATEQGSERVSSVTITATTTLRSTATVMVHQTNKPTPSSTSCSHRILVLGASLGTLLGATVVSLTIVSGLLFRSRRNPNTNSSYSGRPPALASVKGDESYEVGSQPVYEMPEKQGR